MGWISDKKQRELLEQEAERKRIEHETQRAKRQEQMGPIAWEKLIAAIEKDVAEFNREYPERSLDVNKVPSSLRLRYKGTLNDVLVLTLDQQSSMIQVGYPVRSSERRVAAFRIHLSGLDPQLGAMFTNSPSSDSPVSFEKASEIVLEAALF